MTKSEFIVQAKLLPGALDKAAKNQGESAGLVQSHDPALAGMMREVEAIWLRAAAHVRARLER
jgi:hypothetical protein